MAHGKTRHKRQLSRIGGPAMNQLGKVPGQVPGQTGTQQINVNLEDADQMVCDCGCQVFQTGTFVFRISAILSPTGKEVLVNQGILICMQCKTVLQQKDIAGRAADSIAESGGVADGGSTDNGTGDTTIGADS